MKRASLSVDGARSQVAKVVMGAGTFAIPAAFARAGIVAGPILLVAVVALSWSTMSWLMEVTQSVSRRVGEREEDVDAVAAAPDSEGGEPRQSHAGAPSADTPREGQAVLTYTAVVVHIMGERGGKVCTTLAIASSTGVCAAYLAFVATTLQSIPLVAAWGLPTTSVVVLVAAVALLLTLLGSPAALARVAEVGNFAVLGGMLVVTFYALAYEESKLHLLPTVGPLDELVRAFGEIAFLFLIHFLCVGIRCDMESPPGFLRAAKGAFSFCSAVSVVFGVVGASRFGPATHDIVLADMSGGLYITAVKALLCIDLLATYPLFCRPAVTVAMSVTNTGSDDADGAELAARRKLSVVFVATTLGLSLAVPTFGGLAAAVGGICQSLMALVGPAWMHARFKKVGFDCRHGAVIAVGLLLSSMSLLGAISGDNTAHAA